MPNDYVKYDKEAKNCNILFKGIDAPFNIIGLPVFMDYYVTHNLDSNGTNASMTFSQNGRSVKKAPVVSDPDFSYPKTLTVQTATEDDPDAIINAGLIAIGYTLLIIVLVSWFAISQFTEDKLEAWVMGLVILGAVVAALIVGVIVFFLVLGALTPGESFETVEDGDKAIVKVTATRVTVLGLLSLVAYKFFGKKNEEAAPKQAAAIEEESEEEEIANALM